MDSKETRGTSMSLRSSVPRSKRCAALGMRKDFAGHLLGNMALYCGEVRESRRRLEPRANHRPDPVDRATAGRTRALRPQPLGCGASGAAGEDHSGLTAGKTKKEIAQQLGIVRQTVRRWEQRFLQHGAEGLDDAPRSGRPPVLQPEKIAQIVYKTTQETPSDSTHWSTRSLAQEVQVSASSVGRIWRAHDLKPHRVRTFKLSNDRYFAEKTDDVVQLYLNPPPHSIVWSADEQCQIQALSRTQPGLPCAAGHCATKTHDYKRHGTTTLFAAMDVLGGEIVHMFRTQHRHPEWIQFLSLIEERTPPGKQIHLIMDNYSAHKHAAVGEWLAEHPRFHIHPTPPSGSWLNAVERVFSDVREKCLRRRSADSVEALPQAIGQH